jgi:polar amino acid transport system permease protein
MSEILQFWGENLAQLFKGLLISLQVTGAALAIGVPLGLLLALGVQSKFVLARWASLVFVEVGRGAPALVLLQFAYFGLPTAGLTLTSFVAAAGALGWNTAAYTSEIIRAGLEAVPYGEKEAASALGLGRLDALRYVILPQGLRVAAPALLGFASLMLQATSLCFSIALPELTSQAYMIGSDSFRYMAILCLAGILYASICVPATLVVGALERRLGQHTA